MAAVVVGVSKYKYTTRYDLQFADRDALQFSKLLGCTQKVEIDTIITLVNEKATTGNFESTLQYLGRLAADTSSRKIDYLLIYFSGHGKLGPADDDNEGYFIMHNSGGPDADTYGYAHSKLVKKLRILFSGCSRIIMIADACHAGRFTGKKSINLPLLQEQNNFVAEEDRVIEILSSDGEKESFESPNLEHGLFTYYLIRGAEGEAYRNNDGVPSLEALDKYLRSNIDPDKQIPVLKGDKSFFLSFDTCLNYARINQEIIKEKSYESKHKSIPDQLPFEVLFDSLLTAGNICLPFNSSAYAVLKQVKSLKEYAGVYEDMRARYISAVLDEDVEIMYRYLNQDMIPWHTKFADIEKEIQMQKSMLEILRPEDLLSKKTAARYFYFQAMAWYEYSKFVKGKDRIIRLKKADKLITRSLKIKPDSPTAYFLQSQIYLGLNPGENAKKRADQLAETRRRAPEWRLPYLYARDRASLQKYNAIAQEYREFSTQPTQQPLLPVSLATETGKPLTPDQIARAFSGNALLAEDLYLGHALQFNNPENALKKHRKMAFTAYKLAAGTIGMSEPFSPDNIPLAYELNKLGTSNSNADLMVELEINYENQLDADTVVSDATLARWEELRGIESYTTEITTAAPTDRTVHDDSALKELKSEQVYSTSEKESNSFNDPLVGKFVRVKGGTFSMGCTSEQSGCFEDEQPVHQVTLSDFYIAETEVTQAQWQALMGSNPSWFKGCDNCPVENVSWEDVQEFISRLNSRSLSQKYRLPTESEWEYAARGGVNSRGYIYAGGKMIDQVGWSNKSSGRKTQPVKGKKPNELGIYDMSGNVREWCSDWYGDYSAESQTNPQGPSEGIYRVNRGGSWNSFARNCRASHRFINGPDDRVNYLGFRLAASAPR
ncbi:MAG: SUMF1/EgtB/PvdO family nonheme iron enzyme [Saprospiraceae bacterium]|nr:SUMF1/EgtB/PvdO family nonheme iron enzyme [Saprospiraceae bacterium]